MAVTAAVEAVTGDLARGCFDGATPQRWAQAASDRRRSGLSPAATSRVAAVSMPMPKISSIPGAVTVTSSARSSSRDAASASRSCTRRPRLESTVLVA